MSYIANMKVGTKLAVSSGLAIILIAGMIVNQQMSSLAITNATTTVNNEQTILNGIVGSELALVEMRAAANDVLRRISPQSTSAALETLRRSSQTAWDGLDKPISIAKKPDILNQIRQKLRALEASAVDIANKPASNAAVASVEDQAVAEKLKTIEDEAKAAIEESVANAQRFTAGARAELDHAVASATQIGLLVGLSVVLVLIGSVILLMRSIAFPIRQMTTAMRNLASGNNQIEVPFVDQRDEIGEMAAAVGTFKASALDRIRLEKAAEASRLAAEAEGVRTAQERATIAAEQAEVVRRLGEGLQAVAAGDLTVHLNEGFSATYAQIKDDFNDAVGKLKETMIAVVSSTETIDSGTQEIATASGDLARRTEQQAASLEETAAALDQITATVKTSAEGVKHARQVVTDADTDAKKSSIVVRQAVDAMGAIAKSSHQISQIIGVIDEIAFQTNLLALNAGVEAARAGDAGRGFAVVASEVRALAQRSAEAAKEIKGLINTSATQVGQGVVLVEETGKSLDRIMVQVTQINEIVGQIAAGTKEQSSALAEVNVAINQMDQTTQQNAAMVEQSTAASQSLSQETGRLAGLVGQFQVGRSNSDHAMRRELQRAAPHAFRQPAKPAAAAPARKAAPPRKVANGASVASTDESWQEF